MEIHVYRDRDAIGQAAAAVFAAQVLAKPHSVLGLATGSTPLATYDALAQMCARGEVDFRHVCTFNLDEYIGLGRQDAQSYYRFMEENLFRKINIAPCNCHVPNGLAEDIDAECAAYDDAIERAGGIDLQFLGIGHDGHIGFNEPDESFSKGTHLAHLSRMTIEANRRFFASAEEVPRTAISMGIGSIMKARAVVLVVYGEDKAEITARALQGPVTPRVPGSILQFHPRCTVMLDEAAASRL